MQQSECTAENLRCFVCLFFAHLRGAGKEIRHLSGQLREHGNGSAGGYGIADTADADIELLQAVGQGIRFLSRCGGAEQKQG